MIDSAQLQQLDGLFNQLAADNSTSGNGNQQGIAMEIELLLESLFGDDSSNGLPSTGSGLSGASPYGGQQGSGGGTQLAADYTSAAPPSGGSSSEAQPASNAQSKQTAQYFMIHLQQDFGLTKNQAGGIVANLWHESAGMNPGINQGGAVGAPSSDMNSGYGIAQWTGSRKEEFLNYASEHGLSPSSDAANYGFLKQELETTQSGALAAVKNTSSAQDATVAFCDTFERPGDPEMASRLADLQDVMDA